MALAVAVMAVMALFSIYIAGLMQHAGPVAAMSQLIAVGEIGLQVGILTAAGILLFLAFFG